jgi:hypothetical protein
MNMGRHGSIGIGRRLDRREPVAALGVGAHPAAEDGIAGAARTARVGAVCIGVVCLDADPRDRLARSPRQSPAGERKIRRQIGCARRIRLCKVVGRAIVKIRSHRRLRLARIGSGQSEAAEQNPSPLWPRSLVLASWARPAIKARRNRGATPRNRACLAGRTIWP